MTQPINQTQNADIIVVGAGLVGLAAAVAMARQNRTVVLVDAKKPEIKKHQSWDERVYALTPGTVSWLQALGVWEEMDLTRVSDIHAMHLWGEASADPLVLGNHDANLPKLGVIVESQNLMYALWQQIDALGVIVVTDAKCKYIENTQQHIWLGLEDGTEISAKLIIAADGVNSWVRQQADIALKQRDFHQTAIVANFLAEKSHQHVARQWFAPHETLALLPLPEKYVSMVWSVSTESANELLTLSSDELAQKVGAQSRHVLGVLRPVGKILSFRLNQQTAVQLIAERVALVGDVAHQVHPMAGQGVNLGFRDVMQLESLVSATHALQDIGETTFLRKYERSRQADIATMNALTTGLDELFASDINLVKKWTHWGMRQLNQQATIKKLLIQQAVA
ncbi:MAG TPA: FAD-dependent monooxygenase [Methylotenera sp.]|nr:FAD-dependent monooxygenase [Methylotenera sp.]HPV44048.1 FAD-dependent monooxygenase [Methylotenera sp.]